LIWSALSNGPGGAVEAQRKIAGIVDRDQVVAAQVRQLLAV
jgi:hypothetical protein